VISVPDATVPSGDANNCTVVPVDALVPLFVIFNVADAEVFDPAITDAGKFSFVNVSDNLIADGVPSTSETLSANAAV
jgi:hypothetical protein